MPIATNFRRDLAGKAYQLSQYTNLNTTTDNRISNGGGGTYDVTKINERFIKMQEAVRVCFDAIADIATRDSAFLPSFFQGFINPVYVKSTKYTDLSRQVFVNGFNSNGVSRTFPETRYVYSYPDLGDVTTQDYELKVFKNGILMKPEIYSGNTVTLSGDYYVDNSAYGLKAYVKASAVTAADTITLVCNRVYNRTYNFYKKVFTANQANFNSFIDIGPYFPNFYDARYLKVFVKRVGEANYTTIQPSLCVIDANPSNGLIRVIVNSTAFNKDDTLLVLDTTAFWEYWGTGNSNVNGFIGSVKLTYNYQSEEIPVGFLSEKDFDVWFNGRHLIPTRDYILTPDMNGTKENGWKLDFLFKIPANTSYRVDITKNVPYLEGETTLVIKDQLDEKGVEKILNNKYPVMTGIGELYINGKFIDSNNLASGHDNVLIVNNITERQDYFYRINSPANESNNSVLDSHNGSVTEFDKITAIIGGIDEVINRLKANKTTIPLSSSTLTIPSFNGTMIGTDYLSTLDTADYINTFLPVTNGSAVDVTLAANNTLSTGLWYLYNLLGQAVGDANLPLLVSNNIVMDNNN